jgi:simple sugar transport system permease protein
VNSSFAALFAAIARVAVLLALTLGLLVVLLVTSGYDAGDAMQAMVRGAAGSWYAITSATLVRAIPLALAGLAVAIAFRAGLLNIGAEGQLLAGAAGAAAIATLAGKTPGAYVLPFVLFAGVVAGGAWAGIASWLRQRFGVLEVISTIMLNFVALNAVGWLVRGPLQEPTRIYPQTEALVPALQLPVLLSGTRLHLGVVLAVVLAFVSWWWMRSTAGGFRLRAVGMNADAAAVSGRINVARVSLFAFLASGALAGLAGAVELTGVTYALYESLSPGYGYTAIAVALLARLHPLGVLGTAILFGALQAGGNAMQRDAGVPIALVNVVEAVLILLVIAADRLQDVRSRRSRVRADGPSSPVPSHVVSVPS